MAVRLVSAPDYTRQWRLMVVVSAAALAAAAASTPRLPGHPGLQCAPGVWLNGTALSNPAHILRKLKNSTPEACCAACAAGVLCQSWSYWGRGNDIHERHCLTYTTIAPAKAEADAISGAAGPPPRPPPPPPRPIPPPGPPGATNVIMLVADDMRPELGCYGCNHMKTPHLDSLAADAVVFDRAYVGECTRGLPWGLVQNLARAALVCHISLYGMRLHRVDSRDQAAPTP